LVLRGDYRAKRNKHPFAVIEIDIDCFKAINDSYGHNAGDEILCDLSRLIKAQLREVDHFGRVGGEEFLITLPDTTEALAKEIAERVRLIVENHTFHTKEGAPIKLTISLGITIMNPVDKEFINCPSSHAIEMLYKRADKAMYQAKNAGRNRIAVWDGLKTEISTLPSHSDKSN